MDQLSVTHLVRLFLIAQLFDTDQITQISISHMENMKDRFQIIWFSVFKHDGSWRQQFGDEEPAWILVPSHPTTVVKQLFLWRNTFFCRFSC